MQWLFRLVKPLTLSRKCCSDLPEGSTRVITFALRTLLLRPKVNPRKSKLSPRASTTRLFSSLSFNSIRANISSTFNRVSFAPPTHQDHKVVRIANQLCRQTRATTVLKKHSVKKGASRCWPAQGKPLPLAVFRIDSSSYAASLLGPLLPPALLATV